MRNIPLKFSRKKWEVCSMPVLKSFIETLKLTSSILWCVIKYGIKAILCHWSDRELFQFSNMIWAVTKYAFCRRAGMLEILVGTSSSGGHNLPPIPGQLKKKTQKLGGDWETVPTLLYVRSDGLFWSGGKEGSIPFWELPLWSSFLWILAKGSTATTSRYVREWPIH